MPDIGWMELLVIGVVALIVVGPKDLPMMFRKLGQFTGRIRGMARDFQRAMDEAADESGMTDLKKDLGTVSKYANPRKAGMDALNDALGDTLDDIDPAKYDDGSATHALAKKKAAAQKATREAIDARQREKSGDSAPTPPAPKPVEVEAPAADPDDTIAPELPPARTGSDAP